MKLRLDLRLSQKLIMTPQLQQAIKLLQLSRLELQQSLAQHLMENPLLDELPEEAEENESATAEEQAEEAAATAASPTTETPEAETSTPEERENPDEVSAAGWEEYFGTDRRTGGGEGPIVVIGRISVLRADRRQGGVVGRPLALATVDVRVIGTP